VYRAAIISLVTFTSALVGFGLQSLLPDTYVAASKGMIGSVASLDATLLALVLGLLIWTAHGQFTAQLAQLQTIGRSIVLLDLAFAGYGPDAAAGRREIREILKRARARFWIEDPKGRRTVDFAEIPAEVLPMRAVFASLHPTSDEQRQHLVAARDLFGTIVDTQLTMVRSLVNPVPIRIQGRLQASAPAWPVPPRPIRQSSWSAKGRSQFCDCRQGDAGGLGLAQ